MSTALHNAPQPHNPIPPSQEGCHRLESHRLIQESRCQEGDGRSEEGNVSTYFIDVEPMEEDRHEMDEGFMTAMDELTRTAQPKEREMFDMNYLVQMFFYVVLGIAFTQVFIS